MLEVWFWRNASTVMTETNKLMWPLRSPEMRRRLSVACLIVAPLVFALALSLGIVLRHAIGF